MENLTILCDTDVMIEYLKGNETTKRYFDKLEDKNIVLSAITLMELLYGALNKREIKKNKKSFKCI